MKTIEMGEKRMYRIVIIEDDQEVREELKILLYNAGYEAITIENLQGNIEEKMMKQNPHLVLLDINLPEKNGYEICSRIRKQSSVPIIFVTSRNNSMDELNGLVVGGDDYIEKPYNVPVLLARIAGILKRIEKQKNESSIIEYKGIQLNTLNGNVSYQEKEIELPRTEFKTLYYLFKNAGKIIPTVDIIKYMWDNQMYVDDNTLSVNITRIREKLSEIGVYHLIETKRGQGYKI